MGGRCFEPMHVTPAIRVAGALLSSCGGAAAVVPPLAPAIAVPDGRGERVTRGLSAQVAEVAFYEGQLWARGADGTLASVDVATGERRQHLEAHVVVAIRRTAAGGLWALAADPHSSDLRVWQRAGGGWEPLFEMSSPATAPLGLDEIGGRALVVTERALFVLGASGGPRGVALDQPLRRGRVQQMSVAAADASLAYVGANSGELGGALYRVELGTGHVEAVERVDGPGLCDGPFNPGCDPVTGIVRDPERAGCVLAGIGLVHMRTSGRLLRLCDREVSVAWQAAKGRREQRDPVGALRPFLGGAPPETHDLCAIDPSACPPTTDLCELDPDACDGTGRGAEAVLGLAPAGDGVWMVTDRSLYRWSRERAQPFDLPPVAVRGGLPMGALSAAWIVATDVNWAASLSGYTPLVAAAPDLASAIAGPPPPAPTGTCWGGQALEDGAVAPVLCLDRDRFFAKDDRGWSSGLMKWRHRPDRGWSLALASGPLVRVAFTPDRAVFRHSDDEATWSASLPSLAAPEARRLWHEIAEVPRVEEVCERARACDDLARRLDRAEPHDRPSRRRGDLPVDLRGCGDWLRATAAELRASARTPNDPLLRACVTR